MFIFAYTFAIFMLWFNIIVINDFESDSFKFEKSTKYYVLGSIALLSITKYFDTFGTTINYKSATYPILGFIVYYIILKIVLFIMREFVVATVLTFRKMYVTMHKRAFIPLTLDEMKAVDIKSMNDYKDVINQYLRYSCSIFSESYEYYAEPLSYIDLVKSGIALYEELNMFKPIYLNCKFNTLDGFSFVYEE